jgi:hypothetical protein
LEVTTLERWNPFGVFAFRYSKSGDSVVRANFTTKEFAIEKKGTRDFVDEAKLMSGNAELAV